MCCFFGVPEGSLFSTIEQSTGLFSQSAHLLRASWSSFLLPSKKNNTPVRRVVFLASPKGVSSQLSNSPLDCSPNRLTCCEPLGVRFSSLLKKTTHLFGVLFFGVPEGSRTPGLSLRRRTLYPAELRRRIARFLRANIYYQYNYKKSRIN